MLLFDEEQMFLFDHLPRPELKQKDKSVVKPEEKYYLKLFHLKSNDPMKDSHGSATGDITPEINTKKSKNKGPDPKSIDLLKRKYFENLRKKGDKKGVDLKLINAYQKIFEQGVNPT